MYILPMRWVVVLFITSMICSLLPACANLDTIVHGQSISSNQTLTSSGGNFTLGFFTAGPSTSSYLGIWYNTTTTNITVVWVANREAPLDSPGVFTLGIDGNFAVLDGTGKIIWSSNVSVSVSDTNATTGILGDDGNLNLQLGGKQLWQSFHHPSDTLLPGMKLKFNRRTGPKRFLTSWASIEDPRPGKFVLGIDTTGLTQYLLWEEGKPYWRSVIYEGTRSENMFQISKGNTYDISYNFDGDSFFVTFTTSDNTLQVRTLLTPTGQIDVLARSNSSSSWILVMQWPVFLWDFYNACGPNGASDYKSPSKLLCKCLTGFTPKNQKEWDTGNWTGGCVRKMELECGKREGFSKLRRIKLPDHVVFAGNSSITGCHSACLQKCSCTAYAYFNVSEEVMVKCMHWFGDLKDLVQNHTDGKDLYIRLENITDDTNEVVVGRNKNNLSLVIAVPVVVTALLAIIVFGCWLCRKKWQEEEGGEQFLTENTAEDVPTLELVIFEFCSILAATDNFSEANKLGEGGFGPVYKGNLPGNQVVAIKRLSAQSGQGFQEYINELKLIAKLQHTNLVRLLGCCAEQNEKILIYEYMPNRSLDKFLFGPSQEGILDWSIRFRIVEGVAQGLLYLHKYSRLKIIHRDLKASNILLDGAMNPKISDFGMARYFGIEQTEANTNRVVGTYGYMSPEYALYGQFSEKSDVFSFGVLLLEIVSGKKNSDFHRAELYQTLLGWTWDLWKEGTGVDIIDPSIRDTCCSEEALRCIQIGLLCVQEDPVDRPTMHAVVAMLQNEAVQLPSPKEPAFSTRNAAGFSAQPSSSYSYNDMSVSISEPR